MKKFLILFLVCLVLFASSAMSLAKTRILRWAIIPGEAELEAELALWKPIAEYLEQRIADLKVEMKVCTDYTGVIQAMKYGHADVAYFGPFSYVLATTQADVEAVVRAVRKKTGKDGYYSVIITQRYSPIQTLEDLRGKTFAFVEPTSTSGYLVPLTILKKNGIDPETSFKRVFFAGSHGGVIAAVKTGQVDAGATNDTRFAMAIESGYITEAELVIIHRSEFIPWSPVAVRKDMDPELKKAFVKAMLQMPKELALKTATKNLGWVKAKDEDYNFIREMAKILNLNLTKHKSTTPK